MNYIKQLNAYAKKRKMDLLTSSATLLYFVLLEYANSLGFPKKLKIPNSVLVMLSSLPLTTLQRARKELIDKKYINYTFGKNRKECGEYEIIILYDENGGVYGHSGGYSGGYSKGYSNEEKADTVEVTYNKTNKNKSNRNYYYPRKRDRYEEGWHDYDFAEIEKRALERSYKKCFGKE